MLPTFTGRSRRPRNVNLSGQNINPFAASSWTASTSAHGASQSVSHAQAERQQRQLERQRLKAAASIQRTWRGHRARRELRRARRDAFDELYGDGPGRLDAPERTATAFPIILAAFDAKNDDDIRRLCLFAEDLFPSLAEFLEHESVHPSRLKLLVEDLTLCLERLVARRADDAPLLELLLRLVCRITEAAPQALSTPAPAYYAVLAQLCEERDISKEWSGLLAKAALAPLVSTKSDGAISSTIYKAFASGLLMRPNIYLFEQSSEIFSEGLCPDKLGAAIVAFYSGSNIKSANKTDLLWLLAHFIALYQSWAGVSRRHMLFEALYTQLSSLETEVSMRLPIEAAVSSNPSQKVEASGAESLLEPLPPYVKEKLLSLVDREGLSFVLKELASSFAGSSNDDFQAASLLAGYILTLVRCFPRQSDDIRMRLFLCDIPSSTGDVPAIKFLWQTIRRTRTFREISTNPDSPVPLLRAYLSQHLATTDGALQEQEWRAILLFLELYIFILRLSDDEDFFAGIRPEIIQKSKPSRLRMCSLSLADVKSLTAFLKNLSFSLYYNASAILQSQSASHSAAASRLDAYFATQDKTMFPSSNSPSAKPQSAVSTTEPWGAKLDFDSIRRIVTTAIKMLYERDSRRPFLPPDHWLMTSKFDMEGFINAVVSEEQRQREELADDDGEVSGGEYEDDMRQFYFGAGSQPGYLTARGQRLSRHAEIERLREAQRKAQRERMLATIGPKLEILRNMPFVIPFDTRVQIFRQFVHLDKVRRREGVVDPDAWHISAINGFLSNNLRDHGRHRGRIKRGEVFESAFEQFYELGDGLKEPIQITFVDQFDTEEAGIDGGGVTKEFLTSVTNEAFSQHDGISLFSSNAKGLLFPNPRALDEKKEWLRRAGVMENTEEWDEEVRDLLKRYEFLGRIVGKCLYEGILVDIVFAGFFLLKWSSSGQAGENTYRGNVNDLHDLDEELYNGMLWLKNNTEDVSSLGFNFTIDDDVSVPGSKPITRNLMPNGENTPVTNDNRLLYISYVARHRLVVQPAQQTAAFLRGLRSIISPSWLSMFNQTELQRLVGGDSSEIDVEDLRRNTIYSGLYEVGDDGRDHPTVQLFWKVMAGFNDQQRRDVLKYVTSTPRAPLLGFAQLSPKFSIRDGGSDEDRLPSTSTCVNLLKLPRYTTEETLRKKLLYAISSGAGFDLS